MCVWGGGGGRGWEDDNSSVFMAVETLVRCDVSVAACTIV